MSEARDQHPLAVLLTGVVAVLLSPARGLAQDPALHEIRVRVTAVAGDSAFLDKGREAGIERGDQVILEPPGAGQVRGEVQSVSRTSARIRVEGPITAIAPGTTGSLQVPRKRLQGREPPEAAPPRDRKAAPDHPPWQSPLPGGEQDGPLLAPVEGREPCERPFRLSGRSWLSTMNSWNRGRLDQRYSLHSLGFDLTGSNPFGEGGELRLRGDLSNRRSEVEGYPDEETTRGRLDRFSYRYGHASNGERRFEVGRFVQNLFPELGLVDGIEAETRFGQGHRIGLSAGGMPEPFTAQSTGDDVQSALLWRFSAGKEEALDLGIAYQKTWHEGSPDRDLLVFNSFLRPGKDLTLYASAWVDYYTGGETLQDSGFELTEARLNGSYRISKDHGLGLGFSHVRWPDLKRHEFTASAADQILDSRVSRVTGNSWHTLTKDLRLSTRVMYWEDQARDGVSGDIGLAFRDLLMERSVFDVHLFRNDGAYSDGYGVRFLLSHHRGSTSYRIGYEIASYDNDELPPGATEIGVTHALLGGVRSMLTDSTDLSLDLDYRFGDEQDALTVGLYLQTRF